LDDLGELSNTVWARDNKPQCEWLYRLFAYLSDEYSYRYSRVHAADLRLREVLRVCPENISDDKVFRQPPQCMPDMYKCEDSVTAYQKFYIGEKAHFSTWKKREVPLWFS
jgi:hypothetical protein